jgi:hypothetical protein
VGSHPLTGGFAPRPLLPSPQTVLSSSPNWGLCPQTPSPIPSKSVLHPFLFIPIYPNPISESRLDARFRRYGYFYFLKERKTERKKDRKKERQKERKTERQKDIKKERQKERKTERQKERKTERKKDKKKERQKDKKKERQKDKKKERNTDKKERKKKKCQVGQIVGWTNGRSDK